MASTDFQIRFRSTADTSGAEKMFDQLGRIEQGASEARRELDALTQEAAEFGAQKPGGADDDDLLGVKDILRVGEEVKRKINGVGEGLGDVHSKAGKAGASIGDLAKRFGPLAALGTAAIGAIATAWDEMLKSNPKIAQSIQDLGATFKQELGNTLKAQIEWLIDGDLEKALTDVAEAWGANTSQLQAAAQASASAQARSKDLQDELKKEALAARDAAKALGERSRAARADLDRAQQIADARKERDIAAVDADGGLSDQEKIRRRQQIEEQYERERLERQRRERQVEVAQQADEARLAREKALSDAQRAKTLEEYANRKDSADQAVGSGKAAAAAAAAEAFQQLSPELRDEIERINQENKGNIAAFNKALADLLKRYIEAAEKSAREADHEAAEAAKAAREAAKADAADVAAKRLRDEAEALRNADRIKGLDDRDAQKKAQEALDETSKSLKDASGELRGVNDAVRAGEKALQAQIDELAKMAPEGSKAADQIAQIRAMLADGLAGKEFEEVAKILAQWSQNSNKAIADLAQSANTMVSSIATTSQLINQLTVRVNQLESQIRSMR